MPKFYLRLELDLDVDNKLYIVEGTGSYYVTPVESIEDIPQIVKEYVEQRIKKGES